MTRIFTAMIPESLPAWVERSPYPESMRCLGMNRLIIIGFSILLFVTALLARSWQNMVNPGLYMEDASHYFNLYYGLKRELIFILQNPNGYYNILNNLVAWISSYADVRLQPLFYHLFALFTGIATATSLLFSGLLRSRPIILVAAIVLGLSGMNHIYYFITLTFQMYNVVILLLIMLLFPPARSYIAVICQCLVATLLVWSGPYSVLALPISLLALILFRNERKAILCIVTAINVILYSLTVKESTIRIYNIFDETIRRTATQVLFEKVFFFDLLGNISTVKVMVFFILLALVFYFSRQNTFYLKLTLVLFAIIIGALAPLFLSIKFPLYHAVKPCHLFISQFFWLFFLLLTTDQAIAAFSPKTGVKLLVFLLFIGAVFIDNVQHPTKKEKATMPKIPAFVETIHAIEQLDLARDNRYVIVKTDNVVAGKMDPMVRVGSQRRDAHRLQRKDIDLTSGKEFIVD